jgi:hypothetical protein
MGKVGALGRGRQQHHAGGTVTLQEGAQARRGIPVRQRKHDERGNAAIQRLGHARFHRLEYAAIAAVVHEGEQGASGGRRGP